MNHSQENRLRPIAEKIVDTIAREAMGPSLLPERKAIQWVFDILRDVENKTIAREVERDVNASDDDYPPVTG